MAWKLMPWVLGLYTIVFLSSAFKLQFDYTSPSKPHIYILEIVHATCSLTDFNVADLSRLRFFAIDANCSTDYTGCLQIQPSEWLLTENWKHLIASEPNCSGANNTVFTISVYYHIHSEFDGVIFCGTEWSDGSTFNSTNLTISKAREIPSAKDLILNVTNEEDARQCKEFSFECTSSDNQSTYIYEVLRGGEVVMNVTNERSYTPVAEDRFGFSVRCTDSEHPYWRGEGVRASQFFIPNCTIPPHEHTAILCPICKDIKSEYNAGKDNTPILVPAIGVPALSVVGFTVYKIFGGRRASKPPGGADTTA